MIILISYFMILLDNSIIFTALPKIHTAMGFSATGLSWVQDAYTLVSGACCCSVPGPVTCWAGVGCSLSGWWSSRWPRCWSVRHLPAGG